jgi:hypothetical protein
MQKPPSAPTAQGRAGRLLVQQKEEAKERVKQQGRTTRSECVNSRPSYLSLRRQAVTRANPLSGPNLRRECASDRFAFSYICLFATSVRCISEHKFRGLIISNLRRCNSDETASWPRRPCCFGWTREQGLILSFKNNSVRVVKGMDRRGKCQG